MHDGHYIGVERMFEVKPPTKLVHKHDKHKPALMHRNSQGQQFQYLPVRSFLGIRYFEKLATAPWL